MTDPTAGQPSQSTSFVLDPLAREIANQSSVSSNLGQDVIQVTGDKVRLCLLTFKDSLASRASWHAPLGILVTVSAALVTTDFREALGLSSASWKAVFWLLWILTGVWFLYAAYRAFRARDCTVESVVKALKGNPPSPS